MNFNSVLTLPNNVHFVTSGQQSTAADNILVNPDGHHSNVVTSGASHVNTTGAFVSFSHIVQSILSGNTHTPNGFDNPICKK